MTARRLCLFLPLLLCLAGASALAQDNQWALLRLLPDKTVTCVYVRNFAELRARAKDHPFAKVWNDPEIKKFLAPLRTEMGIDRWNDEVLKGTGRTLDELLGLVRGEAVVALTDVDSFFTKDAFGEEHPHVVVLARVSPQAADQQLIADLMKKADEADGKDLDEGEEHKVFTEEQNGIQIHVSQVSKAGKVAKDSVWGLDGDLFFASSPRAAIAPLLPFLRKGRVENPLVERPSFADIAKKMPKADVAVYVELQQLCTRLMSLLKTEMDANPNPMGVTFDGVNKALGLDVLRSFHVGCQIEPTVTRIDAGLHYTELRGVVRLISYSDKPASRPPFLSADSLETSVSTLALGAYYETIKELLNTAAPMIGAMVQGQIVNLRNTTNVDIEKQLIGKFGGEVMASSAYQQPAEPGQVQSLTAMDQLIMVEVQDAQGMEMALNALLNLLAPQGQAPDLFTARDFQGTTIHTFKQPLPGGMGPDAGAAPGAPAPAAERFLHYAFTPKYLMVGIGSPALLQRTLQAMKEPNAAKSIWARPDVEKALAALPPGPWALTVHNTGALVAGMFTAIGEMAGGMAMGMPPGDDDGPGKLVDTTVKLNPRNIAKYFGIGVGGAYRVPEGMSYRYLMFHQ